MHVSVKLPEWGVRCSSSSNEDEVHARLEMRIMQAHGFAQAPSDTVSRYSIADALRSNKSAAAAREVVRPDNQSDGVRRPRFALGQDGSKVTLFLDLLRLVQSSRRACKTGEML